MKADWLESNLQTLSEVPDGFLRLRQTVLKLAIEGKLVSENQDDEPTSKLLEIVRALRDELSCSGPVRKNSKFEPVQSKQQAFRIPEHWAWVRLGEITTKIGSGSTPRGGKAAYVEEGVKFLRSQNVWNTGLLLRDVAFITAETHKKMTNTQVREFDILLNITGASLGRCALVPADLGEANVSQHVTIIRPIIPGIREFLHKCLLSPFAQNMIWGRQVGMAREGLSKKVLEQFEIPLPPLPEQKRIVAKVDELMALIDDLEQKQIHREDVRQKFQTAALAALVKAEGLEELAEAWGRVSDQFSCVVTKDNDIPAFRRSVLQLAIKGELTPLDDSEEMADSLLQRIQDANATSPAHKKFVKRIRQGPETDEVPFAIPSNWVWVRLGTISDRLEYGLSVKASTGIQGIPILSMGHVQGSKVLMTNMKMVPANSKGLPELLLRNGDILFNRTNSWELVGKAGLFVGEGDKTTFASYLIRIRLATGVLPEFLNYVLAAPYFRATQIEPEITQQTNQANFNGTKLANCVVPLPPLNDQIAIVAKVDELMKLCDELEEQLKKKEELGNRLAEAVVAAA